MSGEDHRQNHKNAAENQTGSAAESNPPVIGGNEQNTQVDGHEHESQEQISNKALVERINRSDRWMIFLTAVIAGGGIISAVIFGWQLSVMQGQLSAMEADQRPWLTAKIFILDDLIFDDKGANLRLRFEIKNGGKSPAMDVAVYPVMVLAFPRAMTHLEAQKEFCSKPSLSELAPNQGLGYTVFSDSTQTTIARATIDRAAIEAWRVGTKDKDFFNPRIVSCVNYEFPSSDVRHITANIYRLIAVNPDKGGIPAASLSLEYVGSYAN